MEALIVIAGFIYTGMIGYRVMEKLDRFLDRGGILPHWDEKAEQESR